MSTHSHLSSIDESLTKENIMWVKIAISKMNMHYNLTFGAYYAKMLKKRFLVLINLKSESVKLLMLNLASARQNPFYSKKNSVFFLIALKFFPWKGESRSKIIEINT